jgi:hypothetical protein
MWTGQALPFLLPLLTFFPRSQRGMDRAVTCQPPPRGWSISRTSRNLNGDCLTVTISTRPGLAVASSPRATKALIAPDMRWAIEPPGVRLTSGCRLHPIMAPRGRRISTALAPLWPHPGAMTPIAASLWPGAGWSQLACPPAPHVGTAGVITGFGSLWPRANLGARQGEKRRRGTSKARGGRGHVRQGRAMRQSMTSPKALPVGAQRWTSGRPHG